MYQDKCPQTVSTTPNAGRGHQDTYVQPSLPKPSGKLGNSSEEQAQSKSTGRSDLVSCAQEEADDDCDESEEEDCNESEEEDYDSEPEAEESECESEASGGFGNGTLCDPDFKYDDANVELQAGNRHFWVHKFMLYQFRGLEARLDEAPADEEDNWRLLVLKDSAEDIRNMLQVLYSSPYKPHHFDTATLGSTLKLATKYDSPALRAYAIQQLSPRLLEPIERYRLSRDGNVTEWMSKAIDDLCNRDKPITEHEAGILEPATFAKIAAKREKIQYERGQRAGIHQELGHSSTSTKAIESESPNAPKPTSTSGDASPLLKLPYPPQAATAAA